SMNLKTEGVTCFDKAKQLAAKMVLDAPSGDGFSVLLMKDTSVWVVAEAARDANKVAREIEALRPAHGNSSVPATLNAVVAELAEGAGQFHNRDVYFFTDLQKTTWQALPQPDEAPKQGSGVRPKNALDDLKKHARTIFVDVGRDEAANLAITDLRLDVPIVTTRTPIPIAATIHNFGKKTESRVPVDLRVGKAQEFE